MAVRIAAITPADYAGWLALWQANNNDQAHPLVTETTWGRLCDPASPVNGLLAHSDDGVAGLVHYILHPVTGHINDAAYMQDLFVAPAFREQGIARELLTALAALGRVQGWARLYWLAEADNAAAQALYRHIGLRLDFTFHILPLS